MAKWDFRGVSKNSFSQKSAALELSVVAENDFYE
ncbi:hypothetical protein BGX14_2977 [Fibrobacter sp. UWS1]|nr:hypothetical protein BGX14_2977 [Fibrobacter sp. UWS1]